MPRIRTVKPEFWVSEQVVNCSIPARLLFIGMWNFCDDAGVHPASLQRLKMEVFPGDSIEIKRIDEYISELITHGLLIKYSVGKKDYWQVAGWHHQKIDKPNNKYPLPNISLPISEDSATIRRPLDDNSATPRLSKGCIKGKDVEDICQIADATRPISENPDTNNVQEIFFFWQQNLGHPKAKLDNVRKRKIEQALKLGFNIEDLKLAIIGLSKTAFNLGDNPQKTRYDDLTLVLRDASHIERFIQTAKQSQQVGFASTAFSMPKPNAELLAGAI